MKDLKRKIKIIYRILFNSKRYKYICFDVERPPTEGDTITVGTVGGKYKATFKKI